MVVILSYRYDSLQILTGILTWVQSSYAYQTAITYRHSRDLEVTQAKFGKRSPLPLCPPHWLFDQYSDVVGRGRHHSSVKITNSYTLLLNPKHFSFGSLCSCSWSAGDAGPEVAFLRVSQAQALRNFHWSRNTDYEHIALTKQLTLNKGRFAWT